MKLRHHGTSTTTSPPSATIGARSGLLSAAPEPGTPNSNGKQRIPPQWTWHYHTLVHLRERLLRAHADHATQAITSADMLGGDVADTAQELTSRELLWAGLGKESDQLFEVDCALQRIRDGTYGFCEKTGNAIPAERLRAIPWTRYALAAAQSIERSLAAQEHPR